MNKSLLTVFAITLAALANTALARHNASGVVEDDYVCDRRVEKKCHATGGRGRVNLDTGEVRPKFHFLERQSYVLPYVPEDLADTAPRRDSGPCTWEGIVVHNATSKRTCRAYGSKSDGAVYKVMYQRDDATPTTLITRIFRRPQNAPGAWMVWAEFQDGKVGALSPEAQRFAAAGRGTNRAQPARGVVQSQPRQSGTGSPSSEATPPRAPENPGDIGAAIRDGIFKKLK